MNIIGPSLLYGQNKRDLNWSLVALNPHSGFHP
jgi:hypothetical protein